MLVYYLAIIWVSLFPAWECITQRYMSDVSLLWLVVSHVSFVLLLVGLFLFSFFFWKFILNNQSCPEPFWSVPVGNTGNGKWTERFMPSESISPMFEMKSSACSLACITVSRWGRIFHWHFINVSFTMMQFMGTNGTLRSSWMKVSSAYIVLEWKWHFLAHFL